MGNLVFGSGAEPGRASKARGGLTESPWKEIMTLPNQKESVTILWLRYCHCGIVQNLRKIIELHYFNEESIYIL